MKLAQGYNVHCETAHKEGIEDMRFVVKVT